MKIPLLSDIQAAHDRIKPYIHRTPVLSSSQINRIYGAKIFLKCENFQKVGAFKFRGATNAVLQLPGDEKRNGVVTHSSGNHAAAVTLAAASLGVKAYIVMPENAPEVKKQAVAGYGAEITFCKPTLQAREENSAEIMKRTGAVMIHSYDDFNVICGQGTAAIELLEDQPGLDAVICPIGGGGLMSGIVTASKGLSPGIKVYGAEPLNASDAYRSFAAGKLEPSVNPQTIADGLLTSLSERTFHIIKNNVDNIFTVTEESIIESMHLVWERMKIIIEPSSATTLAVIKENQQFFSGRRIGLIITGGNVDLRRLPFSRVS
jgi:threonine dehydratase